MSMMMRAPRHFSSCTPYVPSNSKAVAVAVALAGLTDDMATGGLMDIRLGVLMGTRYARKPIDQQVMPDPATNTHTV